MKTAYQIYNYCQPVNIYINCDFGGAFFWYSYEPELHPAVCYRIKSLRATLQIFSTGSITVTGIL